MVVPQKLYSRERQGVQLISVLPQGCDRSHSAGSLKRSNIIVEVSTLFIAVRKSSTLMTVTKTRAFALLTIALLWAITPAMACVLPGATMTPAERECCHHMAEQCGSSMMPASHSCCKAQGPTNTVLPQALLGALTAVAVRFHLSFLHAPPPEPSPGYNSVLRI
jgi:RsiW-degrading membrane proteinase PrsW (M82 family)